MNVRQARKVAQSGSAWAARRPDTAWRAFHRLRVSGRRMRDDEDSRAARDMDAAIGLGWALTKADRP